MKEGQVKQIFNWHLFVKPIEGTVFGIGGALIDGIRSIPLPITISIIAGILLLSIIWLWYNFIR